VLLVLWEYRVKPGQVETFESLYRPDGPWTDLFRQSPAFLSTTLWHDRRNPNRYVVADRWTSDVPYDEFMRERAAEVAALGARGRQSWDNESEMGRFDLMD